MSSLSDHAGNDLFAEVDEKALAGADFTAEVIGELRRALASLQQSTGLTQKEIADRLGVSKSGVHRWLYGDGNMTLRKLGELIWAMGCRSNVKIMPDFDPQCSVHEEQEMLRPGTLLPVVAKPDTDTTSQAHWFRLEPIGCEEARRIQATIGPSAPQMRFVGRNGAGQIHQCLMPHGNHAVGYFENCFGKDVLPLPASAVYAVVDHRNSISASSRRARLLDMKVSCAPRELAATGALA